MSNEAPTDALRLVPCPFCGGDVINTRSQEMTEGPAYYWHKCETCGAESEGDYGEDVAVAAWNRRAAPASPLPGDGWQDMTCDEQFALATAIAANIGYVLQPEPDHPDCPHARQGMTKILRDQLNDKSRRLRPLPAAPTGEPK